MLTAPVSEIFFSHQGEGLYVGQPQIFVRFYGCNMYCDYCDTTPKTYARLSVTDTIEEISRLAKKHFSRYPDKPTISFTGGEPLLHASFLGCLFPRLKRLGYTLYLETNGTLPNKARTVMRFVDTVAMDIKLPSSCHKSFWREHLKFLFLSRTKVFVKCVITKYTLRQEIRKAATIIHRVSQNIPLVLQSATAKSGKDHVPPPTLCAFQKEASKKLCHVYIIPQMHKFWNIR